MSSPGAPIDTSSRAAALACVDAVTLHATLVTAFYNKEKSGEDVLDDWTNYVVQHGHDQSDEVAQVLSKLFATLTTIVQRSSNKDSPMGSSSQLLGAFGEDDGRSPSGGLRAKMRGLTVSPRNGDPPAPMTNTCISASSSSRRHRPSNTTALNGSLGNTDMAHLTPPGATTTQLGRVNSTHAPNQQALSGGLEAEDCCGFRLE